MENTNNKNEHRISTEKESIKQILSLAVIVVAFYSLLSTF